MSEKSNSLSVRDTLVRDAVTPVAESGRVPDVKGMQDFIVGVLEGMDRKNPNRTAARPAPVEVEPPTPVASPIMGLQTFESGMRGRLIDRVQMIRRYPELYTQLKNLAICLNSPKKGVRNQAGAALIALVDRTNAIVGHDWRQPPPKKLVFS